METKSLKTANTFIKARYDITEQELKLFTAMIFKIQERGKIRGTIRENEPVTFTYQELQYWLGINKDQYKSIKNIAKRLMGRVLMIEDPEKEMFEMTHFIAYTTYKNGVLELFPDVHLLQHFLYLQDNFTKIPIVTLLQLKNVYAIKMYNLMLEYKNIRRIITITLDDFRLLFNLEKKYTATRDIKKYVLDLMQEELNTVIKNLNFTYKFERENRQYKRIIFEFNNEVLLSNDNNMKLHFISLQKYQKECNCGEKCKYNNKDERCIYCKLMLLHKNKINIASN